MGNLLTSKPWETIKDFNYEFKEVNGQHELRDIDTGQKFEFDVYEGDTTLNQERYEDLGEAITDYVYEYLEEKLELKKVIVPVDAAPEDPKGFFFMSDDALESEKLMILIHGSGVVRAGQWARSLIINHSFESGTMVPYIEEAKKERFGVIITNGNHNNDEILNKRIKGSENPEDHFVYVWNKFIKNAKAKHIVIVAHGFGGVVVLHGVRNIAEAMKRIKAVAFTDSEHSVGGHEAKDIKEWFKKKTRNWVSSSEELDTPIGSYYGGDSCQLVSAGTTELVWTSHCAKESVFKFFKEKLEKEEKKGKGKDVDESNAGKAGEFGGGNLNTGLDEGEKKKLELTEELEKMNEGKGKDEDESNAGKPGEENNREDKGGDLNTGIDEGEKKKVQLAEEFEKMNEAKPGKTTVDSLGYRFFKEQQGKKEVTVLREKETGEKFKFHVYDDKSKNQQRYEELGEAVKDYVQDVCLSGNLKLLKIAIPVDAGKSEAQGFFFMSEDAFYFKKLMILVHGEGAVRAGQWARSVIINENLESGTMVPYIERALEEGFGVIITNGNHNRDSNNRPIQGSESAQDHFVYVWNNFIKTAKTKPDIVIVAHSLGGEVVLHGLKEIDEAMGRIKAVAFTHSTYTTAKETMTTKKWLKEKARDWVCSEEPLDAPVKIDCEDDCDQVSAATMDHAMTSHFAKDSIFKFFKEKLNENDSSFIKPTQFSLISPQDRPLKQDSVYKMTSSPRGIAVIVNVKNFPTKPKESHRSGSEFDVQGLEKLFKGLDFKTKMLIDNTKAELLSEFGKISKYDFSAYDCFVVCIMSHGDENYFFAYDGETIKIQSISDMFNNKNCETLCEKPKLFFINACRGDSFDDGIVVKESCHVSEEPQSSPKPKADTKVIDDQTTAENADMLTAFSSVEGYYSYRNENEGSWFISSLIEVFRKHAGKEDVLSMLTKVNKKVNSKGGLGKKQVPKPQTTLTKKVFFWPGMKFESC